jgi:hypothetical protein
VRIGATVEMTMYVIDGPRVVAPRFSLPTRSFPRPRRRRAARGVRRQHGRGAQRAGHAAGADRGSRGRVSRILPLYLSEQAQFFAGARVRALFPWMENAAGGSFVLMTEATRDADAIGRAQAGGGCDFVVVTHVKAQQNPWSATMRLLRCSDGKCVFQKEAFVTPDRTDLLGVELAIELQRALAEHAGTKPPAASEYLPPAPPQLGSYMLRLEQLLAVRCADVGQGAARHPRDRRWLPAPVPRPSG